MARTRSIEDMVSDVRVRANLEQSELVDDPEICEYLCQELAELKSAIRRAEGQPHDKVNFAVAVTAGVTLYTLPADFWELLGVEATIAGRNRRLEPFMENERGGLIGSTVAPFGSPMYRLVNDTQIEFLPGGLAYSVVLKYVPGAVRLKLGQTPPATYNGCNGYEMAAIYGAVATCNAKEGVDPSFYEGRKQRIMELIKANAAQRDAGAPERVTDVTGGLDSELGFRY